MNATTERIRLDGAGRPRRPRTAADTFAGVVPMGWEWTKVRVKLITSPKLIRLVRHLHGNPDFREWLTPGGGDGGNGQVVSNDALRCVALALLCVTWSVAREHGRFVGDDLVLEELDVSDLDEFAGVPGVGAAMAAVGWARNSSAGGVILPEFRRYNGPLSGAERMRVSRAKSNDPLRRVTPDVARRDANVARQDRDREEENTSPKETCDATAGSRQARPDPKPPPKPPRKPAGPHAEAVAAFCDGWQAKYGQRYPFNGGKDGMAVKALLAHAGGDAGRFAAAVGRYLADDTQFVIDARHTLGLFQSQFARYLVEPKPRARKPVGDKLGGLKAWAERHDAFGGQDGDPGGVPAHDGLPRAGLPGEGAGE